MTALTPSIVEELATRFVDITGYSMRHARALVQAHQGNLEAALRAHLATLEDDERLVKELESQEIHFALCSFGSSSFVWITVKLPEDIVSI